MLEYWVTFSLSTVAHDLCIHGRRNNQVEPGCAAEDLKQLGDCLSLLRSTTEYCGQTHLVGKGGRSRMLALRPGND